MKPNKVQFQDGTLTTPGYCEIGGVRYNTHEPEYSGTTPFSAYNLNKVQSEILADIETNETNIAKNTSNAGTGADNYDNTATYSVGDIVIHNNLLYKCTTAISTAEDFNSNHWTRTSLKEMIDKTNTDNAKVRIANNMFTVAQGVQLVENQSFRIGNMVFLNIKLNANLATSYETYVILNSSIRPSKETVLISTNSMLANSNGWLRTNGEIAIKHEASGQQEDIRILSFYPID